MIFFLFGVHGVVLKDEGAAARLKIFLRTTTRGRDKGTEAGRLRGGGRAGGKNEDDGVSVRLPGESRDGECHNLVKSMEGARKVGGPQGKDAGVFRRTEGKSSGNIAERP